MHCTRFIKFSCSNPGIQTLQDSEVALSIMDALHMLSRKSRTVVCTIHQPNSDLTDLFDDFLLLASGRAVYGGPWRGAVDWFALQGHA